MTDFWQSFWITHGKESQNAEPQVQVLRTLNKQPVTPETFAAIIASVEELLRPEIGNDLLDLCCGNGMITKHFFDKARTVTAVDLSDELVSQITPVASDNIRAYAADARLVGFPENSFDRILLYAGLQYFSEVETIDLFARLRKWLRKDGLIVIGDIPDAMRRWNFFNSLEREGLYFDALKEGKPLVGYWFESEWLIRLARFAGFSSAEVCQQPEGLPYRHYRFDLVLTS